MDKRGGFKTERLFCRGIKPEDARIIVKWRGAPENTRFFLNPAPLTLKRHLEWFESYEDDPGRIDFLVTVLRSNENIGTVGLKNAGGGVWEVSYMIGEPSARGNGYASEMVKGACSYAALKLGAAALKAVIHAENLSSIRLAERLGFSPLPVKDGYFKDYFLAVKTNG